MRRPRLTSLRNKLALLFFAITAAAFGVIYFFVVPQLESNLQDRELAELGGAAREARLTLEELTALQDITADQLDERVRAVADAAGARVTLLNFQQSLGSKPEGGRGLRLYAVSDSREERSVPINEALARRVAVTGQMQTGSVTFRGEELGQVAQPIEYRGEVARVALYSRGFDDIAETVSFIRRRVVGATLAALLIALVGGYLVAQALAHRVRRLERGANALARGRFSAPLPVESQDELGQLTRAFNEMQVQLRQVDVARKEFVATASHELRTPIFSLGGFVELLQDEDLDEETRREFLDTMAEQVARLQKLSMNLLDLSRIDAGSLQLEREPVDLTELARSVLSEFTPAMAEHRTDLEVRLPEDGLQASCDRERVAQVLRILLDNALRHTPEGTRVTVSANDANGAALTVADSGPGLAEGSRGHVFERFYTGDATHGAGLGLAIARELAERMDGRIALESRPGRTCFTLGLPPAGSRVPSR